MKRKIVTPIIIIVLAVVLALSAFATSRVVEAKLSYRDIKITLDGEYITPKDVNGNIVEPFTISGTTYLPIRAVANAFGLDVDWDGSTNTVILTTPQSSQAVYITRTGSKYHYDSSCNGGTYWEVPYSTAVGMGLEPCNKCVLK